MSDISEKHLLEVITQVLAKYICETNPYVLFDGLLDALLEITESEYGFIGEVLHHQDNTPYVKCYATTNIAWNADTKRLYEENKQKGMIFSKLDSLYGYVLKTGQQVISNHPSSDPRSYGLPKGHPPLNAFLGLPFYAGGKLLGLVGIANRKQGYDNEMANALHPFLATCGTLIQAYQNNRKHQDMEKELCKYKQLLPSLPYKDLAHGYRFSFDPLSLSKNQEAVLLSKKELLLLEILVNNINTPVSSLTIESHVWKNVIVGDSSLRSLMRRLRAKVPKLNIVTLSGTGYMLSDAIVTKISQTNHP